MTLATLINRPCSIVRSPRSGSANQYGDKAKQESSTETVWELQPQSAEEGADEVSDDTERAWFLPNVALHSGDSVVDGLTGETFEVEGEPMRWRNPRTQTVEHVEARVKRTVGPADQEGS